MAVAESHEASGESESRQGSLCHNNASGKTSRKYKFFRASAKNCSFFACRFSHAAGRGKGKHSNRLSMVGGVIIAFIMGINEMIKAIWR